MPVMASRLLRIGEVAGRVGVSPDTVRHYERLGLLPVPGRATNGYRQYPESTITRLLAIKNALRCGFSLRELGAFFRRRQQQAPPCRDVRAAAGRKLDALDAEIRALQALRSDLRKILTQWDARLAATPDGRPAELLDSLSSVRPAGSGGRRLVVRHARQRKDA
jgi:DNA-binding transcriptional MerR regulator